MAAGPTPAATAAAPPALVATYRLQLHQGFTFRDAAAIVPYLADLGISHLYLSPVQQAVTGSTHGYDQCDPTRLSDDLGGEAGFRALVAATRDHRLGIILDIVPNHMATSPENPWWWELLRSGRDGRAGTYFDVDWEAPDPDLHNRVMVPVLGAPLEQVLERGELSREDGPSGPELRYFEQRFPLHREPGEVDLAGLLDAQPYALAHWREAFTRLNYRRFFDINSLVALREEDPAVFVTVHALPLSLLERGDIQGLRVDHVDGLRDPHAYLEMLRRRAPGAWLLVEKILEPGERLPLEWRVAGTTGYDFIHRLQGVFIDPGAESALTAFYADFTGETASYVEVVAQAKAEVAEELFSADIARLERILAELCTDAGVAASPAARVAAIRAAAVAMPVYRTYLRPGSPPSAEDRARIDSAMAAVRRAEPALHPDLAGLLESALLVKKDGPLEWEFALRFQQLSGPLMAKGVEDTAFYRYLRLACLNEVGGDPGAFSVSPGAFHAANLEALVDHPTAMLASSTHDTKRSEDVRARIALLSQEPAAWTAAVRRWAALNEPHWGGAVPDRNVEYLLYQTLVGAWPLPEERALEYLTKAAREAKRQTSWIAPDEAYEASLADFIRGVLNSAKFQAELADFARPLVEPGFIQSLAQSLVKMTSPGVPDIYQGTEAWDLSLVDPDNRRAVDYDLRRSLLASSRGAARPGTPGIDAGGERWEDGLAKVHVVAAALRTRRASAEAFGEGSTYTPLTADGPGSDNVLAFARGTREDPMMVVTVVPRLVLRGGPDWAATKLDLGPGEWRDRLWGGPDVPGPAVSLATIFARHTLALLERA